MTATLARIGRTIFALAIAGIGVRAIYFSLSRSSLGPIYRGVPSFPFIPPVPPLEIASGLVLLACALALFSSRAAIAAAVLGWLFVLAVLGVELPRGIAEHTIVPYLPQLLYTVALAALAWFVVDGAAPAILGQTARYVVAVVLLVLTLDCTFLLYLSGTNDSIPWPWLWLLLFSFSCVSAALSIGSGFAKWPLTMLAVGPMLFVAESVDLGRHTPGPLVWAVRCGISLLAVAACIRLASFRPPAAIFVAGLMLFIFPLFSTPFAQWRDVFPWDEVLIFAAIGTGLWAAAERLLPRPEPVLS